MTWATSNVSPTMATDATWIPTSSVFFPYREADATRVYVYPPSRGDAQYQAKLEASHVDHDWACWQGRRRRPSPRQLRARHGYQDAPRLPCYRAVRRK